MTLDELIAIMEYKSKNIEAHIMPGTFVEVVEVLKEYKQLEENVDNDSHI